MVTNFSSQIPISSRKSNDSGQLRGGQCILRDASLQFVCQEWGNAFKLVSTGNRNYIYSDRPALKTYEFRFMMAGFHQNVIIISHLTIPHIRSPLFPDQKPTSLPILNTSGGNHPVWFWWIHKLIIPAEEIPILETDHSLLVSSCVVTNKRS